MNNHTFDDAFDATIPVLTEIIAPGQDFAGAASARTPLPPPIGPDVDETPDAHAVADPIAPADCVDAPSIAGSDGQWQALEHKISERVLRQLQNRIDFVLEHRVKDGVADALQLAVEGIAAEIRRGLHHTLEDVIARAVAQEIAHLQTARNKPAAEPGNESD
ncbi:MAG: hypothetical protein ABI476_07340 [Oxalobacteraceae bacterium]